MAKKQTISGGASLFAKTDQPAFQESKKGKRTAWGVWLEEDEKDQLDRLIANNYPGLSRSQVIRFAVADFLKRHKAGQVKIPVKKQSSLDL